MSPLVKSVPVIVTVENPVVGESDTVGVIVVQAYAEAKDPKQNIARIKIVKVFFIQNTPLKKRKERGFSG